MNQPPPPPPPPASPPGPPNAPTQAPPPPSTDPDVVDMTGIELALDALHTALASLSDESMRAAYGELTHAWHMLAPVASQLATERGATQKALSDATEYRHRAPPPAASPWPPRRTVRATSGAPPGTRSARRGKRPPCPGRCRTTCARPWSSARSCTSSGGPSRAISTACSPTSRRATSTSSCRLSSAAAAA